MLQSVETLPPRTILEMLIRALEASPTPCAAVLDDYHVITAQPVLDCVAFLLDPLPPQLHLVIATRADPPIPLAHLRARGELVELRFTAEETAAFLEQIMGLSLSPQEIDVLETRTEGWIAGLQMAALSMQGRQDIPGFIRAFSGSHRFILDYLVEEVINRQPENIRQFLLHASILERFTAPLCAAELIQKHGQERWSFSDLTFLMLIARLPLEMLQNRPKLGFYYAWMLITRGQLDDAEALLHELAQRLPDDPSDLEVQGMRGFIELLFTYISVLAGKAGQISLPGRQVLEVIPAQFLAMRNSADVVYAMLLSFRGEFEPAAEILLATVRRDLAAQGTTATPISIALLARLHTLQGRLHQAADLCREYLQVIAERGAWRFYLPGNLNIVLGEVLRELLSLYVRTASPGHPSYAKRLLDAFGRPAVSSEFPQPELPEPLTPRELQVLQLICAGYSNQEIAEKLVITLKGDLRLKGDLPLFLRFGSLFSVDAKK